VAFADKFPEQVEFEIDREKLFRYRRRQSIYFCLGFPSLISLILAIAIFGGRVEKQQQWTIEQLVWMGLAYLAVSLAAAVLAGVLIYVVFVRRELTLAVRNLRLVVEGPFLRIVSGGSFVSDRRIHFRAISDYSTHESPLMQDYGMKLLSFHVCGDCDARSTTVAGLKDADNVRDMLCEIDAAREH
jgi:hypothetical protein